RHWPPYGSRQPPPVPPSRVPRERTGKGPDRTARRARPDAWLGNERSWRDREAGSQRSPETQHLRCNGVRSPDWSVHPRNTRTPTTPPSSTGHTPRHPDHPPDTPPRTPTRRARRRHPTRTTTDDPQEATPPTTAASTTTDRDHPPRSCKP